MSEPPEPRPTASILLVDDQLMNLVALEAVLEPLGQRIVRATTGEEALAHLKEEEFAVVLLDVLMPGIDGLVTADRARAGARERGNEVPIILMTAGDTPALQGYAHGAVDVLQKPLDRDVVRAKVAVFVELFRARAQVRRQSARLAGQERIAKARTTALLNASLDAVIGMDHAGRITDFNGAAEAMFGHRRGDVISRPMADILIPPALRERHAAGLARFLATGEAKVLDRRIEVPALRSDGTEFPIELAIRRIAVDGAPMFIAYARDLTEPKRIEKARSFLAQASDAFASSIDFEDTLQGVVRLVVPDMADWCSVELVGDDASTRVNLAVAHVDPSKVALAEELRRRYPPDPSAARGSPRVIRSGRSELYPDIPDAMLVESARDAEHLAILRKLGLRSAMIVPISARARTIGAITLVAAESARRYDAFDLSTAEELARRAAMAFENARLYRESQLAEARTRFLAEATEALASSLDYQTTLQRVARLAVPKVADSAAVYQLAEDGGIHLTVYAAADPAHEIFGRELDSLLPLHIDEQDRLLPRVLRTGRAEMIAEIPVSVRERWSPTSRADELVQLLGIRSYMVVPLIGRGRVLGGLALTTSKSARRFGEDDLELANELARRAGLAIENADLYREAQDANRLKDEFLATISHELRTPLAAILGWTHLLKTGKPGQVERAIETIERNARAQARIVDDVLDVSRIITGKLRLELAKVNLSEIVRAALDTVRPAADAKEIVRVTALDAEDAQLVGDAARLEQVAWNLLSNAIKFTPKGGRVEVRLARAKSNVVLQVSDSGEGIRPGFLPFVFERFRQGDSASTRKHGGLGLGLAIVRHLVELHGGHVAAVSEGEGRGATFTATLPIRAADSETTPHSPNAKQGPPTPVRRRLDGVRVLIVDDEVDALDLAAAILEQAGAQVTIAASASAARESLAHTLPDVLVSDLGMPNEDGYSLIRSIRALGAARGFWFPAIAFTAYAQAEDKKRALAAGFQVHLPKPVDAETLVATIARLASASPDA